MKKLLLSLLFVASLYSLSAQGYQPAEEVRRSQQEFSEDRFGIFIHWGIYSMYAQGEWYLQNAQGIVKFLTQLNFDCNERSYYYAWYFSWFPL